MSQAGDHDKSQPRALPSSTSDEVHKQIRVLAEGTYRPRHEDLRVKLIQTLAEIDEDHRSRGLYNTSVRLSKRHAAQMAYLRSILEIRVRSVVDAHETAESCLDKDALRFLSDETYRICTDHKDELLKDATEQTKKSALGTWVDQSFVGAVVRDVSHELHRAGALIQTEKARLALVNDRRRRSGGESDSRRGQPAGEDTGPERSRASIVAQAEIERRALARLQRANPSQGTLGTAPGATSLPATQPSESPVQSNADPSSGLHEGHRLAAESLAWLAREHPSARTRGDQYALLCSCPAYEGIARPERSSWERYLRDLKRVGDRRRM